jgi:protein Tex
MSTLQQSIATKTGMALAIVNTIIELLDQGNTVPFIARYRKELTQGATDEQLRDFHDIYTYTKNLEARKEAVIRLIDEKWLLSDELRQQIMDADTLAKVEDLYRPFKEKKMSKATIAKAKWLDPLAQLLKQCSLSTDAFAQAADAYIKDTGDSKTSVLSREEAIQWAQDIIAEEASDHAILRDDIRQYESSRVTLQTKASKKFDPNGVYKIYGDYNKKLAEMPSYAYLAIARAEEEKQLSVSLWRSDTQIFTLASKYFIPQKHDTAVSYLQDAISDGIRRLLMPSLEREFRSDKKQRADEAAIKVFGENMRQLLLTPPVRGRRVLWFDPAFRTGCKLAVVDETGKFLDKTVIYPTDPQNKIAESEQTILTLIKKHNLDLIVIGNGTASRESSAFINNMIKKHKIKIDYMVVSEAGASVYSASKLAQEEYPDLDVTIRGAISIAHRVQDPLAELTKIEPKSIGVGQYQHDVDQKLLGQKLDERVEDVVNSVWVDVNTASYTLLQYIAWLTPTIAKNIVNYRDENGPFTSKVQLKKVKWLWPKAYEQAVWFLRIIWGKEPLDATGIHPEIYDKVYAMIKSELQIDKKKLTLPLQIDNPNIATRSEKYDIGHDTLIDVIKELQRPWQDPRDDLAPPSFAAEIMEISDLKIGMQLEGIVRNITDFGAFVDIGLHNDGLVHKSQMADRYVGHPIDVVSLWQKVKVKVLEIDINREKVSLSMKSQDNPTPKPQNKPSQINTQRQQIENKEPTTLKGNISWS